jgi:hypothetical protein
VLVGERMPPAKDFDRLGRDEKIGRDQSYPSLSSERCR